MSHPVLERITIKVADRLAELTTANGYQITLGDVVRPQKKSNDSVEHLQPWLVQGSPSRWNEGDLVGNPYAIAWEVPYLVWIIVRPSDNDGTPTDRLINLVLAEVQKAICTPLATWESWDDLAVDTEIKEPQFLEFEGEAGLAVAFVFHVRYRVNINDPYTARP